MAYQRAFVTGANGFIGSALCRRLLRDGLAVRAMCRSASNGKSLNEQGAEVVEGDVQNPALVERYTQGCDVVFHVAAVGSGSAAYHYNINVEGTRNVFRAAHHAGAQRFIHVSSVIVYGYDIAGLIEESHPQRISRDDFYMQTKAMGEQLVWDMARSTGLPTIAIRPAMVYGPGSNFWSRTLYNIISRYPVPHVEHGQGSAHPIFIDDVIDLLVTAANHPAAPGQVFNAAPDPAPTWGEFLGYYARMAGNTAAFDVPLALIQPLGALITLATRLTGRPVDAYGAMQIMGRRATYSMTKAARVLDWRPQISLEEGMAFTEPWLKNAALPTGRSVIG
jgi:nucleoside-diphosphate-sugar epimerase